MSAPGHEPPARDAGTGCDWRGGRNIVIVLPQLVSSSGAASADMTAARKLRAMSVSASAVAL